MHLLKIQSDAMKEPNDEAQCAAQMYYNVGQAKLLSRKEFQKIAELNVGTQLNMYGSLLAIESVAAKVSVHEVTQKNSCNLFTIV